MNEDFQITSAATKGDLFCHYGYRTPLNEKKEAWDTIPTVKSERPMHDDLRMAFLALRMHMPVIFEDLAPGELPDINSDLNNFAGTDEAKIMIEKYRLFSVEFDHDNNKIRLHGTKKLDGGLVSVTSYWIKLNGGTYHYQLELNLSADHLKAEVMEYINGKQAPVLEQGVLFNGTDNKKKKKPKKEKAAIEVGPDGYINADDLPSETDVDFDESVHNDLSEEGEL